MSSCLSVCKVCLLSTLASVTLKFPDHRQNTLVFLLSAVRVNTSVFMHSSRNFFLFLMAISPQQQEYTPSWQNCAADVANISSSIDHESTGQKFVDSAKLRNIQKWCKLYFESSKQIQGEFLSFYVEC